MSAHLLFIVGVLLAAPFVRTDDGALSPLGPLYALPPGQTRMVNALWGENPPERQFGSGRTRVVVADLKGPGIITMIHFAMPQTLRMNRDTVLRIWWDGEATPSVEAPLVDFFCDPNGALERVDSAIVNKKRGWNCYFPMPFRRSARVEVECDNPRYPSGIPSANPCYSYVMYRSVPSVPKEAAYFHAQWRQKTVRLDQEEYEALRAEGKGEFVGWNVSVRTTDSPAVAYFVDENEKFRIDGETEPSIEWQGLEDSFGFSWGFPEQANAFQLTGYQPWYNGAAAYRFCLSDRIGFRKALRITIGFGKEELKAWRGMFPKGMPPHEFSSTVYWYQTEPHAPFPGLPGARDRAPSGQPIRTGTPLEAGDTLELRCGSPEGDIQYLADGWDFSFKQGYGFSGPPWTSEVKHCWADPESLRFDLTCPRGASGSLRLYLLDGDNFAGGRKQSVAVNGKAVGTFEGFQAGRWVDVPVAAKDTADGRITVAMRNLRPGSNAVVTYVRFHSAP